MEGEIQSLSLHQGLSNVGKTEYLCKFTHVGKYKSICIATASDVIVQVVLEWSHDGREPDGNFKLLSHSYRTPSDQWRVETVAVTLPFLRIRIINSSGVNNDRFHLCSYGKGLEYREPEVCSDEVEPSGDEKKDEKKSFFSRKRRGSATGRSMPPPGIVRSVESFDARIPGYLPPGSILIAGSNNKFELLPRGIEGEYLMIDSDGRPAWTLPYPPVNK